MTEVRIRNVEGWVVDSIRQQARLKAQSLEATLRELLHQEAMRPRLELRSKLREMREELRKKYGTFSDSAALIREDRDARMMVLDASVVVKTYLEEAGSEAATELLGRPVTLLAPELIRLDVAGALCRRVRKGELEAGEAEERCQHWQAELDKGLFALTPDRELLPEAIALATKLKHTLHDCLYLAVAIRSHAPLITADRPFYERARPLYKQITLLKGCEKN